MDKDGILNETNATTKKSLHETVCESHSSTRSKTDNLEFVRSSANSDFLVVAQFICTFGPLLGIPKISLDVLEDGLDKDCKTIHNLYFDACSDALERLVISMLRRCGYLTNTEKLSETLYGYFEQYNDTLCSELQETSYRDLSSSLKLEILKDICLNQFNDNSKFKTDFNSQYSPEELRFKPLGRDFDSSQYWFIADHEHSHRLYRWKYPYTAENWSLVSSYLEELQKLVLHVTPPDIAEIRQGKLGQVFQQEIQPVVVSEKPKKKAKKDNIQKAEEKADEEDKDVQFHVRKRDLKARKSQRKVDRKVYTEDNEENNTSEEEEKLHREYDDKCKIALNIAHARKRTKKFLSVNDSKQTTVHTKKQCHYSTPVRDTALTSNTPFKPNANPEFRTSQTNSSLNTSNTSNTPFKPNTNPELRTSQTNSSLNTSNTSNTPSAINPNSSVASERSTPDKKAASFHHQILLPKDQQTPHILDTPPDTSLDTSGTKPPFIKSEKFVKTEQFPSDNVIMSSSKNCKIEIIPKIEPESEKTRIFNDPFPDTDQNHKTSLHNRTRAPLSNRTDPFAFPNEDSRHSETSESQKSYESSQSDPFDFCPSNLKDKIKDGMFHSREYTSSKRKPPMERLKHANKYINTQVRTKPPQQQINRKSTMYKIYQPEPVFDPEFLHILDTIPSIKNYQKPKEAKDICWKCNSEEDVEKMLFCDGCDLATYHMTCLSPPITDVPEDDWYCPVCEQCMLYLRLRHKLQTITAYTRQRQQLRQQSRKSNCTSIKFKTQNSQHNVNAYRQSTTARNTPMSTVQHNTVATLQHSPNTPPNGKPAPKHHIAVPRPRTKITQIGRLAETAKRVYEHNLSDGSRSSPEDGNVRIYRGNDRPYRTAVKTPYQGFRPNYSRYVTAEDTTSSSEVEDEAVDTSRDMTRASCSSQRRYGTRPNSLWYNPRTLHTRQANRVNKKLIPGDQDYDGYTADDFLADCGRRGTDSSESVSEQNTFSEQGEVQDQKPAREEHSRHGGSGRRISVEVAASSRGNTKSGTFEFDDAKYKAKIPTTRITSIKYDPRHYMKTKAAQNAGSGNVVTDTSHLTEQQKKALAAWEEMERNREPQHDEFEFDG